MLALGWSKAGFETGVRAVDKWTIPVWWVRLDAYRVAPYVARSTWGARLPKLFILPGRSQWETNFHMRRGHICCKYCMLLFPPSSPLSCCLETLPTCCRASFEAALLSGVSSFYPLTSCCPRSRSFVNIPLSPAAVRSDTQLTYLALPGSPLRNLSVPKH